MGISVTKFQWGVEANTTRIATKAQRYRRMPPMKRLLLAAVAAILICSPAHGEELKGIPLHFEYMRGDIDIGGFAISLDVDGQIRVAQTWMLCRPPHGTWMQIAAIVMAAARKQTIITVHGITRNVEPPDAAYPHPVFYIQRLGALGYHWEKRYFVCP